ncbi:MAG: ACT domain-containing protein [Frankiales bacterium]|nr:ACT domain-containing protein [Frankiales bacterium]
MPAHLRVSLADRPGALAALARALAGAGANVLSVTVTEREQGRAVDDLLLDWPYERPFDAVVRAVESCDGARLHGLRHVSESAPSRDCDVMQQVVDQPHRAIETVIDALPHLMLADWCAAFDRRWPREVVYGTAGSPLPLPETTGPLDRPRAFAVREETLMLVQVPGTALRLLVGRYDGPAFSRSEVDRAAALVSATAGVIRLADASSLARLEG